VIDRVSFRAFVAATEDEGRVREALGIFVPLDRISSTTAQGHFGNEIKILEASLRKKDALAFFKFFTSSFQKRTWRGCAGRSQTD